MDEKKKIISGGFWTGLASGVTMFSQFIRIMILTRYLDRSDFGVVAIINMVIGLCLAFGDLGFSSVIMYKKNLSKIEFSSLYWLQLFIYCIIYILLCAASPLLSMFYIEQSLLLLIPLSALSLISLAIGKLYESILQKKYEFKLLSIRNIFSNILSLFLAWWMAWRGYGIYSLIFSTLFQNIVYNIWSLCAGLKYQKISIRFSYKISKPLLNIGIYQTYTRIADYISSQLDVLIIGKLLGTDALGGYDLAKQLVNRFVNFFKQTISQVALPVLSNHNNDADVVRDRFLSITRIVAIICIPVSFSIAVFSEEIIKFVYGVKYIDTALIASVFAITTIITSISCLFDMLGIVKGRTDLNFKNTIYRIIITIPITIGASLISIEAVAWGQLLAAALQVIIFWKIVVMKTYPMNFHIYMSTFSKTLLVWFAMSALLYILKDVLCIMTFLSNEYAQLLVYMFIGLCIVIIAYSSILRQDAKFLSNILKR